MLAGTEALGFESSEGPMGARGRKKYCLVILWSLEFVANFVIRWHHWPVMIFATLITRP